MKRLLLAVAILLLLAGGGLAAAWVWNERQTRDVRGSSTKEFVPAEEPGTTTQPEAAEEPVDEEPWPTYGLDSTRSRYAAGLDHRPPFRKLWKVEGRSLIEFPPVIAYGRLYVATTAGRFLAIEAASGQVVWERNLKRITAASPALADGIVYQPLMSARGQNRATAPGYLVAMDAETGEELWRFRAGVVESSPLVLDGVVYFGTFDDKLYALDAGTGRVRWTYKTGDDVKGGPAFRQGTVYFGSYDGKVYALDARSGKLRWSSGGQSGLRGAGNFYATPAVAYGRVFIGNTDGKIYAFGARSGDLLWSRSTSGYVYSSAAVWKRTIYAGSYDGRFYALDAATGDVRWSFETGGPISGSPTILAGLVYFSTFEGRTYALDARTGKKVWTFPDGKYTPLVADEERVYLVGFSRIYGLEPAA